MENKKAMISTFTHGDNYGQRLQNLALQTLLEECGYETWTFDQPKTMTLLKRIKHCIRHPLRAYAEKKRKIIFNQFNRKFIRLYKAKSSMENLYEKRLKDKFNLFIAGSDQIWNPYSPDVNTSHFLSFVPKEKKIAFAASFSVDEIPDDKKEIYKYYLSLFEEKRISVRETQGFNIIKSLLNIEVPVILDPTMMYDEDFWVNYEKIPRIKLDERYVLVYVLGQYDISYISSQFLGKQIVDLINDSKFYANIGPQEFLWLIRNADMIITDSYHCIIFSLLFKKNFQIINRKSRGFSMKSRFDTLFEKFNLKEEGLSFGNSLNYNVPYDDFLNRLESERENTRKFMKLAGI